MSISIGNFRRNVMKTVSAKQTKSGLRYSSKNSQRALMVKLGVAVARSAGNLIQSQENYILGVQINQEAKEKAAYYLGEVGGDLVALAKVLKVKTPTATKKKKLIGTRTAALMQMQSISTDLLFLVEALLFDKLSTKIVKKDVKNPKTGVSGIRDVAVVNVEVEEQVFTDLKKSFISATEALIALYWPLCYDITEHSPSLVMRQKLGRMKADYPEITFEKEVVKETIAA